MNKIDELCAIFHVIYEDEAVRNGWNTQDSCKVPFQSLPEKNKNTMRKTVERFIAEYEQSQWHDKPKWEKE